MSDTGNVEGCGCLIVGCAPVIAFFVAIGAWLGWHFAMWMFG